MEGKLFGGRYRLGNLLGAGGMGDVFVAIDERIGGRVALKLLRPGDADSIALERFFSSTRRRHRCAARFPRACD